MKIDKEYWSAQDNKLSIKAMFITEKTTKPPSFSDADSIVIKPVAGNIRVYSYSRMTHAVVDIPNVLKLTPTNLYPLIRVVVVFHSVCDQISVYFANSNPITPSDR